MSRLICYCFGYTEEDLCQDTLRHGRSLIMERIVAEKKRGPLPVRGDKPHWPLMFGPSPPGGGLDFKNHCLEEAL